jgi:HAD superfamily hydrolase (TIGR01549 family)
MARVRYLLWDIDGTLYRSREELAEAILDETYSRISSGLSIPYEEARRRFLALYSELGGATAAVIKLGLSRELIQQAVDSVDKTKYVRRDPRLREMLEVKLRDFTHIIVTNTSKRGTLRTLEILGLSPNIFQGIITADDVHRSKPDTEPFEKALEMTGELADQHVSIGDREKVDIAPAKKLGMRTIFVWGISKLADASVATVYGVPEILESWRRQAEPRKELLDVHRSFT